MHCHALEIQKWLIAQCRWVLTFRHFTQCFQLNLHFIFQHGNWIKISLCLYFFGFKRAKMSKVLLILRCMCAQCAISELNNVRYCECKKNNAKCAQMCMYDVRCTYWYCSDKINHLKRPTQYCVFPSQMNKFDCIDMTKFKICIANRKLISIQDAIQSLFNANMWFCSMACIISVKLYLALRSRTCSLPIFPSILLHYNIVRYFVIWLQAFVFALFKLH